METEDVLREFAEAGALLKGHFILSSGLHSDTYLNKSIVSMHPERTARLCRALADSVTHEIGDTVDFVVSPALGAIIYGYETARALHRPFMFVERVDGLFQLRRGFHLPAGARVLVVEDIVSTGLSARECIAAVRAAGGDVRALACLIDRSGGRAVFDAPLIALARLDVRAWPAHDLPAHLVGTPAVKPGSRGITQ